jgi:hypothetical protein
VFLFGGGSGKKNGLKDKTEPQAVSPVPYFDRTCLFRYTRPYFLEKEDIEFSSPAAVNKKKYLM